MWRNSASPIFSARILLSSKRNPKFISSTSPSPYLSSVVSSQSTPKLGIVDNESARIGAFASQALGMSFRARDALELGRSYAHCYWELSKARLSMVVVATSGTGYILGSGNTVDRLCWTCVGTMMVAASANSLNQVFEKTNDAKMKRTRQRPLPSGRITVPHAITWASCVGSAGTALLACKANTLAAGLAASNLILYAFAYTPLKQIHPVNTWVGAIVGAIPPLLGLAAASGEVSLNGMILPAALYFWQIPHFMALAYLCRNDYATGGFKMFSLTDATGLRTAAVVLRNCLYLFRGGSYAMILWAGVITSGWFCMESTVLTLAISAAAYSLYRDRTTQKARRMFHVSLLYLPVFMSGLLFHPLSSDDHAQGVSSKRMIAMYESDYIITKNKDEKRPNIETLSTPTCGVCLRCTFSISARAILC